MKNDNHFNRNTDNDSFARIIHTVVKEYNNAPDEFTKVQIKWSLQTIVNCWSDKPYKLISKGIADHFINNHPKINPFKLRWKTCKKYGVVNKKRYIVFEHTTPISMVMKQLFLTNTLSEVNQVLNDYSGICLITRNEDDTLYSKGYGSKRLNGWKQAYNDCDIVVMSESDYITYYKKRGR